MLHAEASVFLHPAIIRRYILFQQRYTAFPAAVGFRRVFCLTDNAVQTARRRFVIQLIRKRKLRMIPEPVADLQIMPCEHSAAVRFHNRFLSAVRCLHLDLIFRIAVVLIAVMRPDAAFLVRHDRFIGLLCRRGYFAQQHTYEKYRRYRRAGEKRLRNQCWSCRPLLFLKPISGSGIRNTANTAPAF